MSNLKIHPCQHSSCIWLPILRKYTNIDFVPDILCESFYQVHKKFRKKNKFSILTQFNSYHDELNNDLRPVETLLNSVKNGVIHKYKAVEHEREIIIPMINKMNKLKKIMDEKRHWNQKIGNLMRCIKSYRKKGQSCDKDDTEPVSYT